MALDETANGSLVRARVGEEIELALAENPTTGFRWTVVEDGAPVCRVAADAFEGGGGPPGAGGVRRVRLAVVAAGSCRVALERRRPWQPGAPARRLELRVEAATP